MKQQEIRDGFRGYEDGDKAKGMPCKATMLKGEARAFGIRSSGQI